MQGPVLLPSSPLTLPSPFAPCGSCRKHLKPSGSWRENPHALKATGMSWGTPRVVLVRVNMGRRD